MIWACVVWNMFLWGGTIYLIAERGWSAWWVVLALLLTDYYSSPSRKS